MADTVLSHIAMKLGSHPENLATEALWFILNGSAQARAALADTVRRLGYDCSESLSYATQQSEADGSRPDLVGTTPAGERVLYIEAKFWAGLTGAQPVSYLEAVPETGGALVFLAPEKRLATLWPELLRRCRDACLDVPAESNPVDATYSVKLGNRVLALVSWRYLQDVLGGAMDRAGDGSHAADIQQLRGLCDKMDTEAFLPLRSEELAPEVGRRVYQFCELANEITDSLVGDGKADITNLRATGGKGFYGRYLRLKEKAYGCFLHLRSWTWASCGCSPLWLLIKNDAWKRVPGLEDELRRHGITVFVSIEGFPCVPIFLRTGVERQQVVQSAVAQIDSVIAALPVLSATAGADSEPTPGDVGSDGASPDTSGVTES